jgi:hypothetical protein
MDEDTIPTTPLAVISREEARGKGLKFFYTGIPCPKGHLALRRVCNRDCVDCTKKPPRVTRICAVDGCDKKSRCHGYCLKHFWRYKQHGDPLAGGVESGARLRWLEEHKNYDGDDCLIFPFGNNKWYPTVRVNGKTCSAHSVMNRMANGEMPADKHLSGHSCGNGGIGCVAPRHLRWYTHEENAADRIVHGTQLYGSDCGNSKLTEDDVRAIRSLRGKILIREIAEMFGVSKGTIKSISSRKTWRHID